MRYAIVTIDESKHVGDFHLLEIMYVTKEDLISVARYAVVNILGYDEEDADDNILGNYDSIVDYLNDINDAGQSIKIEYIIDQNLNIVYYAKGCEVSKEM